jgi:predicted permease
MNFDALLRDLRYAVRSFRRAPLVALTIVTTVGLGLGLVAAVFTILNAFVFRVAEVRNPDELFAVVRQRSANAEPEGFTRAQYDALLRETAVFSDAFATIGLDAYVEGHRREGPLVTGNYFQVLGVSAARGRTLTPSDDQPGGLPVIVLSHRAWSLYFASDPGVLHRSVRVNGTPFRIVGVMPEGFRGLAALAAPDYWAPLSLAGLFRSGRQVRDEVGTLEIVGRLKPGLSRDQALAQLIVWDSQHARERSRERSTANLVLEPRRGTIPLSTDVMVMFTPLFFAFGLILVIGCANVANLLLARAVARQREIGIRLAVGASRRRVVQQLLTESLVLALVSSALAFGISRIVLSGVIHAVTSTWPPDIGNLRLAVPPADWRVALFLVAGAMVSPLFFAFVPALQATRVELVRAIRGEVVRDGPPGRARDALVAVQVTGSVLLLICAAVFLRSTWTAATVDLGIRMTGVLSVTVLNEEKRGAILEAVRSEPLVASVAASWPMWIGGRPGFAEAPSAEAGSPGGATKKSAVTYQFVSPEYFGVHDVALVRGRGFTPSERNASVAVAIVSETLARQLWPGMEAVGQILRIDSGPPATDQPLVPRSVVVVGVARDVEGLRVGDVRLAGAGVYLPIDAEVAKTALTMRVRGDSERARTALVDRLAAIDPNMGEVSSLEIIRLGAEYLLSIPFWLTLALGALALALTLSGLFSVLSYLVEQRTREIGVRMALGATRESIAALVLSQSARPIGIGLLLGGTLTAGIGAALLAMPGAALIGSIVHVFDPVAYAASLLCIVAACVCAALIPALRAARINPVAALRQY